MDVHLNERERVHRGKWINNARIHWTLLACLSSMRRRIFNQWEKSQREHRETLKLQEVSLSRRVNRHAETRKREREIERERDERRKNRTQEDHEWHVCTWRVKRKCTHDSGEGEDAGSKCIRSTTSREERRERERKKSEKKKRVKGQDEYCVRMCTPCTRFKVYSHFSSAGDIDWTSYWRNRWNWFRLSMRRLICT